MAFNCRLYRQADLYTFDKTVLRSELFFIFRLQQNTFSLVVKMKILSQSKKKIEQMEVLSIRAQNPFTHFSFGALYFYRIKVSVFSHQLNLILSGNTSSENFANEFFTRDSKIKTFA